MTSLLGPQPQEGVVKGEDDWPALEPALFAAERCMAVSYMTGRGQEKAVDLIEVQARLESVVSVANLRVGIGPRFPCLRRLGCCSDSLTETLVGRVYSSADRQPRTTLWDRRWSSSSVVRLVVC